jgi:hypothetical protein
MNSTMQMLHFKGKPLQWDAGQSFVHLHVAMIPTESAYAWVTDTDNRNLNFRLGCDLKEQVIEILALNLI